MSEHESTEHESTEHKSIEQKVDAEANNRHQDLESGTQNDNSSVDKQNNNEGANDTGNNDDVECNKKENLEDTDRKAKEDLGLLSRLSSRIGVGGEVARKVGRRGFERPNVAISNRIYEQYDVPDPWAPKSKKKSNKWETRLGVSLKLGEAKRQPGQHLMPKEPKKKIVATKQTNPAESFKPKGIPQAPKTKPKPPPPPPKPERVSTFGGPKKHGVVGKIPIRPDLQDTKSESRSVSPTTNSRNSKVRPALKKTNRTTSTSPQKKNTATQQEIERRTALFGQSTSENTSSKTSKSRRLKRTKATQRPPKITKIDQPQSSQSPPVVEAPPSESPPRSVKPASQPSMDDIFGGTVSKENRPRLGRRKKRS